MNRDDFLAKSFGYAPNPNGRSFALTVTMRNGKKALVEIEQLQASQLLAVLFDAVNHLNAIDPDAIPLDESVAAHANEPVGIGLTLDAEPGFARMTVRSGFLAVQFRIHLNTIRDGLALYDALAVRPIADFPDTKN